MKNERAGSGLPRGIFSSLENPPEDQWTEYEFFDKKKIIRTRVPFRSMEFDLIIHAQEALEHGDFNNRVHDGGPERNHRRLLRIPNGQMLTDRKASIKMLQDTARAADDILEKNEFTPRLNSRQAVVDVREAIDPFTQV